MIASGLQNVALTTLALALATNTPSCAGARSATPVQSSRTSERGKEMSSAMTSQEAHRVKEAADRFVQRFRETLDFGLVFDEMFVSDAVQRLRKAGFFQGMNISPQLIEQLDDGTLERAYKAFMNFYYLNGVYDLSVGKESPPPEVAAAIKASRFYNLLSVEGSEAQLTITTQEELKQFIADLNNVAALYRQQLSRDVFDSPTYKASLKAINKEGRRALQVKNGYEDFGVKENVKVYGVEQDLFIFFFVEENSELKVLTLGIGN